jgi:hypothetical protein
MNEWHPIPGERLADQAVRVAGALAELGVSSLDRVVSHDEGVRSALQTNTLETLHARRTDLPAVLRSLGPIESLLAPSIGIEIAARPASRGSDDAAPRLLWRLLAGANDDQRSRFAHQIGVGA